MQKGLIFVHITQCILILLKVQMGLQSAHHIRTFTNMVNHCPLQIFEQNLSGLAKAVQGLKEIFLRVDAKSTTKQ